MSHKGGFSGHWRWRSALGLLLLGAALIVLWRIPGLGWLAYPFRLFGTFIHELSHGLAAVATGGDFHRFIVNPDLSGVAWSAGGVRWIVASAGYIGSALFGALLILLSRVLSARMLLFFLGLTLALSCAFFVRNAFGAIAGLALAAALLLAARTLRGRLSEGLLLVIALQIQLDGFGSMLDLFALSWRPDVHTDAHTLAQLSGVGAPFWAISWALFSAAMALLVLWFATQRPAQPPPNRVPKQRDG